MDKRKTCCFTGHRNISRNVTLRLSAELEQVVREMISNGIRCFMTGGARGFDTLAAETVLRLRNEFPQIRLTLVLPCQNQTRRWRPDDIRRYETVIKQADKVTYTGQTYTPDCMSRRNRYLVDNSSVCVAYCTRDMGGSAYTVRYARRSGVRIVMLGTK